MRRALLVMTVCLAVAGACGGKAAPARPAPTTAPTAAVTHRDLTDEEMALIPLALGEWGARYEGYQPEDGSGTATLTSRANSSCQPSKEAAALSKYGWTRGFTRSFGSVESDGTNAGSVESDIDVYGTPDGAANMLTYSQATARDDTRVFEGCFGLTIEGVDDLVVTGLGDQVAGVRERFSLSGIRGSFSVVQFRRGRVLVSVSVLRMTSEDSTAELMDRARKMDERLMPLLTAPLS